MRSVFSIEPIDSVIARRAHFAPDAAIIDDAICYPGTKYGCTGRSRTLEGRERKQNEAAIPMFFVISIPFCYVLPCFGAGCHTFGLKIATAALRPRNDTKLGRFWGKNSLLCKDFDTLKGSAGLCPALPFFAILVRQRSSLARRAKEPLNQSAAALGGSFVPAYRFENHGNL